MFSFSKTITFILFIGIFPPGWSQISSTGGLAFNFGIDGGFYSNQIEYGSGSPAAGSWDWFTSPGTGRGVIDESSPETIQALLQGGGNPTYERRMVTGIKNVFDGLFLIDGLFARDEFGGRGAIDQSSFATASKNGEDPAIWDPGTSKVLGKNDLIDIALLMFREGNQATDDLWITGVINRAQPGGDAYMDFEFFVEPITLDPVSGFSSGGPDLGHTAFRFDESGEITQIGDYIFNVSLGGGTTVNIEIRLWVSYADYQANLHPTSFSWGSEFDGASSGAPYGYASIVPNTPEVIGYVNLDDETPQAPPWGTLNTKSHVWGTAYQEYAVTELAANLSRLGIDPVIVGGETELCSIPTHTVIIKTRSSSSFSSSLKDFAGPFSWGQASMTATILDGPLSCSNSSVTLSPVPNEPGYTYSWSTLDGNILTDPNLAEITVNQPGTYIVTGNTSNGCVVDAAEVVVENASSSNPIGSLSAVATVACSGNDGSIDLTVEGGAIPLLYSWSNSSTLEDPSGLAPGSYSVIVTDNNDCTSSLSNIIVPAKVPANITFDLTQVSCNGSRDGSIDASVGGNPPYQYQWSNGSVSEDITGLGAGTYSLTVTDANGCSTSASTTITQSETLTLSATHTDDTDPSATGNGSIDLSVSEGTAAYSFLWKEDGATFDGNDSEDLSALNAGIFTVVVTDANGCTKNLSVELYEPEICDDGIDNDGDGLIDCLDNQCIPVTPGTITPSDSPICVGDSGITYTVQEVTGYTYSWEVPAGATIVSGSGTNQITVDWTSNSGGKICVKSVSSSGCESTSASCFTVVLTDVPNKTGSIIKGL